MPLRERKKEREEVKEETKHIRKNVIIVIRKRQYSTMCASDQLTQKNFQPPLGKTVLIFGVLKQVITYYQNPYQSYSMTKTSRGFITAYTALYTTADTMHRIKSTA